MSNAEYREVLLDIIRLAQKEIDRLDEPKGAKKYEARD